MSARWTRWSLGIGGWALLAMAAGAHGQPMVAGEADGAAADRMFLVEAWGLLHDSLAVPATATAVLVTRPSWGSLSCPGADDLELCPDGSFDYTPDPGFVGTDSFTYQTVDRTFEGDTPGNVAMATISVGGCEPVTVAGPPPIDGFVCSMESAYLAKLTELGYGSFQEGFEDDVAWGSARSPNTQDHVLSQGIDWQPNNGTSGITTGSRARTGLWGLFELPHGITTGADTDPQRDGFAGTWTGVDSLLAVGAWLNTNTGGAKVRFALDGVEVGFANPALSAVDAFFGLIDTTGFVGFEIFETEGRVNHQENIFADDFTFGTAGGLVFADDFESGTTSAWSQVVP